MEDTRALKHQITLLNAALHCVCSALSSEQKTQALSSFVLLTQFAQSKLEASSASEEELLFYIELQQSLEKALTP